MEYMYICMHMYMYNMAAVWTFSLASSSMFITHKHFKIRGSLSGAVANLSLLGYHVVSLDV